MSLNRPMPTPFTRWSANPGKRDVNRAHPLADADAERDIARAKVDERVVTASARPQRWARRRRHRPRDRAGRPDTDGRRPHQRPRHRDHLRRPGRSPRHPPRAGRPRTGGLRAQSGAGSLVGRRRSGGGGADGADPARPCRPGNAEPEEPRPQIDLDVVSGGPRRGGFNYAVSNSFAVGGHNVALVFGAAW